MKSCILCGPTAVGKSSFVMRLADEYGFLRPRPFTTRTPRSHASFAREYDHFNPSQVASCRESGSILSESVLGETYGYSAMVPFVFVDNAKVALHALSNLAFAIRDQAPTDPLLILLRHPTEETMIRRIEERCGYDQSMTRQRLELSRHELRQADRFDHVLDVDCYESTFQVIVDLLRRDNEVAGQC
jgi:guanylate kinase